jgi:hypothetical protein
MVFWHQIKGLLPTRDGEVVKEIQSHPKSHCLAAKRHHICRLKTATTLHVLTYATHALLIIFNIY